MNKPVIKVDVLKKVIAKLVKAAPARAEEPGDPLGRLIRAFMEYDCDATRAEQAEKKLQSNMVDFNELRVTPAVELAGLLGVRYPFAEHRCSSLHRTLQSIFEREHQMKMSRLAEMKKPEVRIYLQSLAGITPYVEAAVCVDCFGIPAVPVDTKLVLYLVSKDALPEGLDLKTAQGILEKHVKASDTADFFHGSRKEIDDWSPKSWPTLAKAYSPVLAPPPVNGPIVEQVPLTAEETQAGMDGKKKIEPPKKQEKKKAVAGKGKGK